MTSREAATIRARRMFKERNMNLPNNPSEATKKRNPNLFTIPAPKTHDPDKEIWKAKMPQIIRQSSKPVMNKTETEFFEILKSRFCTVNLHAQSITFKLCNGCTFRPDFVLSDHYAPMVAYEVKGGFIRDDAIVKLKMAAQQYPTLTWILAQKTKEGWKEQRILE